MDSSAKSVSNHGSSQRARDRELAWRLNNGKGHVDSSDGHRDDRHLSRFGENPGPHPCRQAKDPIAQAINEAGHRLGI